MHISKKDPEYFNQDINQAIFQVERNLTEIAIEVKDGLLFSHDEYHEEIADPLYQTIVALHFICALVVTQRKEIQQLQQEIARLKGKS